MCKSGAVHRIEVAALLLCALTLSCSPADHPAASVPARSAGVLPPTRIVSLVPNLTEVLFALGLDDRIVGVSSFCDYPPAANTKPRVGGVLNPDIETILALEPDLVVNIPGNASQQVIARLDGLGVPTLVVSTETVEETFAAIEMLGTRTGCRDRADALVEKMRAELDHVRSQANTVPARKTLFVIGHNPLYVAGKNTFIDDLIEIAGGVNIARDALGSYPRFGIEEIIARAPEVIIDSTLGSAFPDRDVATRRRWWDQWDAVPAVQAKRIYGLDTDMLLRPGPRMIETALMLARAIHPEVFDGASAR